MKKTLFLSLSVLVFLVSSFIIIADDPTTVAGAKNILSTYRTNYPKSPSGKKPGNFGYLHGTISGTVEAKNISITTSATTIKWLTN